MNSLAAIRLAVAVVPASVQERDTLPAFDQGEAAWPSLRIAMPDGAFTAGRCRCWSNRHGTRRGTGPRVPGQKGFSVLPGRQVVKRSFGWLTRWDGLQRDCAGRLDVGEALRAVLASAEAPINPAAAACAAGSGASAAGPADRRRRHS